MILNIISFIFIFLNIGFGYSENSTNITLNACKSKICIPKCCPFNQYVGARKKCIAYIKDLTFDDLKVFNNDKMYSEKNARDVFEFAPGRFTNISFRREALDLSRINFRMYLLETGVLSMELPNAYERWIDLNMENYCVDYVVNNKTQPMPRFWSIMPSDSPPESNIYLTSAILISCFFLLLVLIVYTILPELRNLCGKILMAYVTSLFFAFLFLAIIQMQQHTVEACLGLSYSIYFCFLASFCWMNIMSYDIWWTFRGYAKARPIHRRGESFKFMMYCIYGFGLPLAMTCTLGVLNMKNIMIQYPWFVTPKIPEKGCFLEGGEKLLYLYVPMLILILCNWLFFLMTTFNIWRLSRGTAVLDSAAAGTPAAHRTHRHRFMVYLKLSIVMGLNWVLEVASFLTPKLSIWYISDLYNILIGFAIFLIFVCKPKIIRKLRKAVYRSDRSPGWVISTTYSTSSSLSNSSHDNTLPICNNPKGPYVMNNF